jgi:hypothetical protein
MFLWITTLLVAALNLGGPGISSDTVAGTVRASGPVFLNGVPVTQVTVVTDGDKLVTGPGGVASLDVSSTDRLTLGERGAMLVRSSRAGVSVEMERGRVQVNAAQERLRGVRLSTVGVSIATTASEDGSPHDYMVTRLETAAYVLARRGSVTVHDEARGGTTEVPAGMVGKIDSPAAEPPQATQRPTPASTGSVRHAGTITALMPTDYIYRAGAKTLAAKDAPVNWLDEVESSGNGRARIVLEDGSILSVGSKSRLKIVQHDAQSQNTSLELLGGKVRAEVRKLSSPSGSFEIRTSTAVCGVLGTDFYLETDGKKTRLVVLEGRVSFRPIINGVIAAAAAGVTVVAGQMSSAAAGAVAAPVTSSLASTTVSASTSVASQGASVATTVATQTLSRVAIIAASAAPAAATVTAVAVVNANNPSPSPSVP